MYTFTSPLGLQSLPRISVSRGSSSTCTRIRHRPAVLCARPTTSSPIPTACADATQSSFDKSSTSPAAAARALLESADFLDRIRAINRICDTHTGHELLELLLPVSQQDSNAQVRFSALSRLAAIPRDDIADEDANRVLIIARKLLREDPDPSCRAGAADVIAGLRLRDGFDDLVQAFQESTDWILRFSIAAGMGELGEPRAFEFLKEILQGECDAMLTTAAVGALGDLGDKRAVDIIKGYTESEEEGVRERAKISLEQLTGQGNSRGEVQQT